MEQVPKFHFLNLKAKKRTLMYMNSVFSQGSLSLKKNWLVLGPALSADVECVFSLCYVESFSLILTSEDKSNSGLVLSPFGIPTDFPF